MSEKNIAPAPLVGEVDYLAKEIKQREMVVDHERRARPELDSFSDVYPQAEIDKDKALVSNIKAKFQKQYDQVTSQRAKEKMYAGKKRSDAMEIIVGDEIEFDNWFGPNVLCTRTTEYDDLINGVDAVVEFTGLEDTPQRIALGIDASSRADMNKVKQKIERNISKILNNTLEVKYFESRADGFKGSMKDIIPVVIGIEGSDSNELIDKYASLIQLNTQDGGKPIDEQKIAELRQELAHHPAQVIFLREIQDQLLMYFHILWDENNPRIFVKPEQLMESIYLIKSILDGKENDVDQAGLKLLERDGMYNLIQYVSRSHNSAARNSKP